MTKTLISWGMALTVLCSGLATSCSSSNDEDEGGGNPPAPTVAIAPGNATASTLQFTLTLRDADKCTYLCKEKSAAAPAAAEILSAGKSASASGSITVDQLTSNTAYRLYAIASKGSVNGSISTADHTTLAQPVVKLTPGSVITKTTLTFTAELTDAQSGAYVCFEKTADAVVPTAEAILRDGKPIAASGDITVEELTESTTYLIAAAASNGSILSEVATLEMTTDGPIRFSMQAAGGYKGKPADSSYGEYSVVLADGQAVEVDGVYSTLDAGMAMSFDLYQLIPTNLSSITLPARNYKYAVSKSLSTFHPDKTYCMVNDGKGNLSKIEFKAGTIAVTQSGSTYTFTVNLTTTADEPFEATYTGPIVITDQSGSEPDKLPELEADVTDITYIRALAKYYTDSDQADNCIVHLYDVQPGGLDYGADYLLGAGHMVALDLSTAVSEEMKLQEGVYNLSSTGAPGSYAAGYQTEFMDDMLAVGTYCEKRNDQSLSVYGFINSGTVTISKAGDGYRFVLDMKTDKNHKITGTYEGVVEMTDKR